MHKFSFGLVAALYAAVSFAQTKVPIDSVSYYVGRNVNVCSKVYNSRALEKMTLINLGAAYPKSTLSIIIFNKDLKNFSSPPEHMYKDKTICVTGLIHEFRTQLISRLEIVITKPEEMVIYDEQEGKINSDKH